MRRLAVLVLIAACGKSSPPSGNAPAAGAPGASGASGASAMPNIAPPAAGDDRCEIHVRGDYTGDAVIAHPHAQPSSRQSRISAATDYWMTDDQLRMGLAAMAGIGAGGKQSYEANAAAAEAAMKKDPRMFLLTLVCGNEQAQIQLEPAPGSHYADVPYGPKQYHLTMNGPKPGEFGARLVIKQQDQRLAFVPTDGTLDITKFDKTGIAGTFHFTGKNVGGDHTITADGSFDYACMGTQACQQ